MEWSAQIDIYCERLDASFWAEPLNALSNIAFILAALWGAYVARQRGITAWSVWVLIALAFAIGVGSFLFHTHATRWASLTDVVPILLFVVLYAITALALIGGAGPIRIFLYGIAVIAALGIVGFLVAQSGISINGSEGYLPALALMIGISALTGARGHPAFAWFAVATLAFMLSLTFRSIDMAVCESFPTGTHIFWHLLNGVVIALLLQALIRTSTRTITP